MSEKEEQSIILRNHLENELKELEIVEEKTRWKLDNIIAASNHELLVTVDQNALKDDQQTKSFCEFIAAASIFSSADFKDKVSTVPELVNITKELIDAVLKEVKEFSDIALDFREIINCFIRLVMETQKNLSKLLPYLENSATFLEMYIDAQKPGINGTLTDIDRKDVNIALENLIDGVNGVKTFANLFECESNIVDSRIKTLKDTVIGKIHIVNNRITFQQLLSPAGAVLGGTLGVSATQVAIQSSVMGGIGALVVGGVTFPPMGAILLGALIGSLGMGTIFYMVKRLWENHQYKALGFLKEILKKLDELNVANTEFVKLMNKSSVHATRLQINIEQLKKLSLDESIRTKKANIAICERALESSRLIIKTMDVVNQFDLSSWVNREEICFQESCVKSELMRLESASKAKTKSSSSKTGKLKRFFHRERK